MYLTDRILTIDYDRSRHNSVVDEVKRQNAIIELVEEKEDDTDFLFDCVVQHENAPGTFKAMYVAYKRGDWKSLEVHAKSLCSDIESDVEEYVEIKVNV